MGRGRARGEREMYRNERGSTETGKSVGTQAHGGGGGGGREGRGGMGR